MIGKSLENKLKLFRGPSRKYLILLLLGATACSQPTSTDSTAKIWFGKMKVAAAFSRLLSRDQCTEPEDHKNANRLENKLSSCSFTDHQPIATGVYSRCLTDSFKFFESIQSKQCREKYVPELRDILRNMAAVAIEVSLNSPSGEAPLTTADTTGLSQILPEDIWAHVYPERFQKALNFMNQWVVQTRPHLYRNENTSSIFYTSKNDKTLLDPEASFLADFNHLNATMWSQISAIMEQMERAKYFKVTHHDLKNSADTQKGKTSSFEFLITALEVLNQQAMALNIDPELRAQLLALEFKEIYPRIKIFAELHDFSQEILNSERVMRNDNPTSNVAFGILSLGGIDSCLGDPQCERHQPRVLERQESGPDKLWPRYLQSVWNLVGNKEILRSLLAHNNTTPSLGSEEMTAQSVSKLTEQQILAPARDFMSWVRLFRSVANSFQAEGSDHADQTRAPGFFYGESTPILYHGLTQEYLSPAGKADQALETIQSKLTKIITEYEQAKNEGLREAQSANDVASQKSRLNLELRNTMAELINSRADLVGHQEKLRDNRELIRRKMMEELLNSTRWKATAGAGTIHGQTVTLNISGAHAPTELRSQSIESLAVRNFQGIDGEKGDVLSFNVTGLYHPDCAIQQSQYKEMASGKGVGPEGYALQMSNGESQIISASQSKASREFRTEVNTDSQASSQTNSDTTEVHAAVEAYVEVGFTLFGNGGGVTASAGVRQSHAETHAETYSQQKALSNGTEVSFGKTDQTTDNRESRTTASFDRGIHLVNTPFPHLPAGALLLVSVPKNTSRISKHMDIRALSHQTSVLVEEPSHYYLVVNDCHSDRYPDKQLSVHFEHKKESSENAKQVTAAMLSAMSLITEAADRALAMNALPASLVQSLTAQARAKLSEGAHNIHRDQPVLVPIFESWIAEEIDEIHTRVSIQQLERKMEPLVRTESQLRQSLELLHEKSKLSALGWQWATQDFDFNNARLVTEVALYKLRNEILPILRLRHPETYHDFIKQEGRSFQQISILEDQIDIIKRLKKMIELLENYRESKQPGWVVEPTLVIRFLRPDSMAREQTPFSFAELKRSPYADIIHSLQPFDILGAQTQEDDDNVVVCMSDLGKPENCKKTSSDQSGHFKITPQDLYGAVLKGSRRQFGTGSLNCGTIFPIIKKMGIFIESDANEDDQNIHNMNERRLEGDLHLISDSTFMDEETEFSYHVQPGLMDTKVPFFFGKEGVGLNSFLNFINSASVTPVDWGISPMGEFVIDLGVLGLDSNPMKEMKKLVKSIQFIFQTTAIKVRGHSTAKACENVEKNFY